MTDLLVVLPLLGRPKRVQLVLRSLEDATPEDHDVVLACTQTDHAVVLEAQAAAATRPNVRVQLSPPRYVGDYAKKVNQAYRESDHPFLFLGADDLRFEWGWWVAARRQLDANSRIGVVGTNDLAPTDRARRGEHSTHSVVRRSYVQERGLIDGGDAILYEGYTHEYVDDELVGTAKHRQAWCYAADSIVEHLHPHWGKAPTDSIYRKSNQRMVRDRRLIALRRRLWS
jgi:hypothetical protein